MPNCQSVRSSVQVFFISLLGNEQLNIAMVPKAAYAAVSTPGQRATASQRCMQPPGLGTIASKVTESAQNNHLPAPNLGGKAPSIYYGSL